MGFCACLDCAATCGNWLFHGADHRAFLTLWSLSLLVILTYWWWRWRAAHDDMRESASARGTRRITLMAALIGVFWAAPTLFLFAGASDAQRAMLASSQAGMMTGGAIALATVWQAATAYFLVIELACLSAFLYHGGAAYLSLAAMSAIFAAMIAVVVLERGRMFVATFLANQELRDKSGVISLMLREFEKNASDWLFEIGANARFVRV